MSNWTFHLPGKPTNQPARTQVTATPTTGQAPIASPQRTMAPPALPQHHTNGSAPDSQRKPVPAPRPQPVQVQAMPTMSATRNQAERLGEVLGIVGRYNGGLDLSKAELEALETQVGNMLIKVYETYGGFNDQTIRHTISYIQSYTKPWEHVRHLLGLMEANPATREELLNCWLYGVLKYGLVPLMQAVGTISLIVGVLLNPAHL